ncbi:conserved hypothetical protein [Vibrio nigripulchritudo MADA3029]|uniref:Uncharacterized protein n=2 Tax=Vibrio nigripulchritudo TaxID=28173 RepID=U4KHV9_9VIBR|nr:MULTISPECIES: DUF6482 family protein [Vibrio]EGU57167.1 hypothetical protein VINI7043_05996 [Vibrio nigripulchritudo ATCC 27043]KJY79599.1 hypothetical protein TW74_09165 [Vibrio nigripulchritudo]UAB73312.1 hypothetical protein INR79_19280 [Vibrio sp. SCSIO 43132]CCN38447.1 conserved hypothetical protein [Vibrio nigripulchritudo AM115]CCN44263.1 conserved hypothetical protein [Vibrio nigripulchritudo FTn2]
MKMPISKLEKYFSVDKLVVHSLDMSLYQLSAVIDGEEWFITEEDGQLIRAWSVVDIQRRYRNVEAKEKVLRQESAYDEMVGCPDKVTSNMFEVPIGDNKLY